MVAPEPRLIAAGERELARLPELEAFRASLVEGGPALPEITQRLLLDTLGLGNREAIDFVVRERPSPEAFRRWIVSTAGAPDAHLLERLCAHVENRKPAAAAAHSLAFIESMPDVLDAGDLQHWDDNGFVVLREAIDPDACMRVERLIWQSLEGVPDDPTSWHRGETEGIMVPIYRHPALQVARQSRRVHKAFAQLWDTANLWCTVDQLGFNPPETGQHKFRGSAIHWDVSLSRPVPFATQAVLYLADTAADQGAFRCVPGFHHRLDDWLDTIGDRDPRAVDLTSGAVCVPGKAGDLVIWRQDLPHGASPNRSDRPRLVQYLNYYAPHLAIATEWL